MLEFRGKKGVEFCDGLSRRDFLKAGALSAGAVGLSLTELAQAGLAGTSKRDINCILLFLVGGPSHLDTFDPKPHAPAEVRGPFQPIRTSVPGMEVCEHLPRLAAMADRYAIVRSVHHDEAPIHETGHQMMQTGHLFRGGQERPHYGAALSHLRGPRQEGVPSYVVLPAPISNTGVSVSHGQGAGPLGIRHEPFVLEVDPARMTSRRQLLDAVDQAHRASDATRNGSEALFEPRAKKAFDLSREPTDLRARYGKNTFGQSCLLARRLVENGVRLATVNMFDCVFNETTWDCHADGGALATTLDDYRDVLCPMFDMAYTTLLEDLTQRGLLETTLVVAMGEFGRTPKINPRGGRDHWPGCWSVLFAGAGVRGGQVVGASDRTGSEPRDRPVTPAQIAATVYHALGIDPRSLIPGSEGGAVPLVEADPISELFRG
jgi:uncharacterized protein (DUF1501 family)